MSRITIAQGIIFESTPSHGYFHLSGNRQQQMPEYLRLPSYEEDVEWARVALVFPDAFSKKMVDTAHQIMKDYHPDFYSQFMGQPLNPSESRALRERKFRAQNANNYVGISAYGAWCETVPKGWVGVLAGKGGRQEDGQYPPETAYFLVPADEYRQRSEFGYVINHDTCRIWYGPE